MKISTLTLEQTQLIETLASQYDLKNVRLHLPIVGNEKQSINLLIDLKDNKTELNQVDLFELALSEKLGYLVRVKSRIHLPAPEYEKRQAIAVNITEYERLQDLFAKNDYELEKWQNLMPSNTESSNFQRFTFESPLKYPPIPTLPDFASFFPKNKRPLAAINNKVIPTLQEEEQEENKNKKAKLIETIVSNVIKFEIAELQEINKAVDKINQLKLANCKPNEFDNGTKISMVSQKN